MTFNQAEDKCKKLGGHLVTVRDGAMNAALQKQLGIKYELNNLIPYYGSYFLIKKITNSCYQARSYMLRS